MFNQRVIVLQIPLFNNSSYAYLNHSREKTDHKQRIFFRLYHEIVFHLSYNVIIHNYLYKLSRKKTQKSRLLKLIFLANTYIHMIFIFKQWQSFKIAKLSCIKRGLLFRTFKVGKLYESTEKRTKNNARRTKIAQKKNQRTLYIFAIVVFGPKVDNRVVYYLYRPVFQLILATTQNYNCRKCTRSFNFYQVQFYRDITVFIYVPELI